MPILDLLHGRSSDIGGLIVNRLLPQARRRAIGPFVFVDHMGPAVLRPGQELEVRPHPHIGLATVTYLFEGAILHRDSLGCVQRIDPGDVNWMTAGRGIVHSERQPDELRGRDCPIHGVQTWIALPAEAEDAPPAFVHVDAAQLPAWERDGARVRVIAGNAFGATAPVPVFSSTLYCAAELDAGATLAIPDEHAERAVFVAGGAVAIDGAPAQTDELAVLAPGAARITAQTPARLMLLGGAPLGERLMWWNFVATSRERIEAAKAEWSAYATAAGSARFPRVPGDDAFIPLPPR